ncbi:hypothetical protein Ga0080559_TMP4319 [Salipiger profundus]|uniref:Uncharacterized protein n=1 Tax=Salipiger profundus TaxID=1229727 RepID=A0A1U7DAN6_9RHOB|nr:hypothetical protein Ga0080559_TMP4319 [Salipiger profundus]
MGREEARGLCPRPRLRAVSPEGIFRTGEDHGGVSGPRRWRVSRRRASR